MSGHKNEIIQQSGNFGVGVNKGTIHAQQLGGVNQTLPDHLIETIREVEQLLERLEQTYPARTTLDRMTIATEAIKTIDRTPNLRYRILSALKAGGLQAFEQFMNHPMASFFIGVLDDWQKSQG
ncbi:hypothetical protein ACQ4M3_26575 [Leptolyngbya sp. AN03gr2]|uniref:hypothetical protein n=1 Tax=unclassified Leptolyngbya TaxID=2650499 RepID=UPI003D30FDEC